MTVSYICCDWSNFLIKIVYLDMPLVNDSDWQRSGICTIESQNSPLKPKKEEAHTQIDKSSRESHAQYTEQTALCYPGGHSATLIENCSNIYFYLFLFQISKQNKRKQNWYLFKKPYFYEENTKAMIRN